MAYTEKTALDLEWPSLLDGIAALCQSDRGSEVVRSLRPSSSLGEAQIRLAESREALELVRIDAPLPRVHPGEWDDLIQRLELGMVASGLELREMVSLLRDAHRLRVHLTGHKDDLPQLFSAYMTSKDLDALLEKIDPAVEHDGSVADSASPALAKARKQARDIRTELNNTLRRVARRLTDVLRDPTPVERDGRYTLAVRSDAHYSVDGIVLGTSGSGSTLYVEPRETTPLGNRLRLSLAEADAEEARVLAKLSGWVQEHISDVQQAFDACCQIDALNGITSWSKKTHSIHVPLDDAPRIKLKNMRHPLLIGAVDVVPNDLLLEGGEGLIISGPNAGGKTVALKAMGLAVWMARAGLPLPVDEGSKLGWFGTVLTDIGDAQSLELSLSTFSGQVTHLVRFLEQASPETLILLDELAAGTDPDEGSALAQSVLEHLVARGASVVVATHYERLKRLGEAHEQFNNASVGFDFDTLQATFRLHLNRPGASAALEVAKRYGLDEAVVVRARELMPKSQVQSEDILTKLESEQSALNAARERAESEARAATKLRASLERERQVARSEEQKRLAREAQDLTTRVREARALIENAKKRFRVKGLEAEELSALEKDVTEAGKLISWGSPLQERARPGRTKSPDAGISETQIEPGMNVQITTLGAKGTVLSKPKKGKVQVQVGSVKTTVSVATLSVAGKAVTHNPKPPRKQRKASPSAAPGPAAAAVRTPGNTCDLRGLRVEEALDLVDTHMDALLGAGDPAGFVLHGHGTGALRSAVRAHLDQSPYVDSSRPAEQDEGGDAFTVFWLRG